MRDMKKNTCVSLNWLGDFSLDRIKLHRADDTILLRRNTFEKEKKKSNMNKNFSSKREKSIEVKLWKSARFPQLHPSSSKLNGDQAVLFFKRKLRMPSAWNAIPLNMKSVHRPKLYLILATSIVTGLIPEYLRSGGKNNQITYTTFKTYPHKVENQQRWHEMTTNKWYHEINKW